jgi:Mg-chelatase subunit ChlD
MDAIELEKTSKAEQAKGKLKSQFEEDKLMKSVLQNDKKKIEEGKIIADAINQGIMGFTPDMMFETMVQSYQVAKQLYGEKLIRLLAGYNPDYIKRNINIPEFKKELKTAISRKIEQLKDEELIDSDGLITEKGVSLASLVMYTEELDHIVPKGVFGEKIHKKTSHYGDKKDVKLYTKGDRYKDLAVRKSIRLAIRRGHSRLQEQDLKTFERHSKGSVYIIYGLDSSGSMKGKKIETAKKAGIALAYKAISQKDNVGLISFGTDVKSSIAPTKDFSFLLREITKIRASKQTDFTAMIRKAVEMFPRKKVTKHLILLTDAMPTVGEKPEEETLEAISIARAGGITVSIVGINLDRDGIKLAKQIAMLGEGRLYQVKNLENVDKIILEDYYSVI